MASSRQTRSTLRDFLSARGSSASIIDLSPAPTDTAPTGAVNEGDDLGNDPNTGQPILGLSGLASAYVAFITQQEESRNLYTLESAGETAAPMDRGDAIVPAEQQGATRVFARAGTTLGQAMILSNSGIQDETDYPLSSYLDKTAADATKSGDYLLAAVEGRPLDTSGNVEIDTYVDVSTQSGKMQTGVVQTLDGNNRSTPSAGRVAIPNAISTNEIDERPLQAVQRDYTYNKDDSATSQAYTYDRIKGVADWLLASAAGYQIPGNQDESQPTSDYFRLDKTNAGRSITQAAALLRTKLNPDTALPFDNVQPSNARGFPKQPNGASMRQDRGMVKQPDDGDAPYTRPSPVTYTADTPFGDVTNTGSTKLEQARAYIAISNLASLINTDIVASSDSNDSLKSLGPYYMGGSVYSRVNSLNRMIMNVSYVPTKNKYKEAVVAGMGLILGKKPGSPAQAKEGYFGVLQDSAGFWQAVAQSAVDIIKKQKKPVEDISPQYYIEISRSKAVQVMNVFATVGDILLEVTGRKYDADTLSKDVKTAAGIEQVDDLPVTPGTRISKNREGGGRSPLALSWRGNSVPGLYLLSDDVVKASMQMGNVLTGDSPARGMLASTLVDKTYTDPNMKGNKARIPADIVKIMEDKLDAEYVPFYFHDLRTNEIISFHAFLESLSDNFSARYSSYKSYGRSDAAKTYAGTDRSVSLSFVVAATSREDFDELWYKLNRLIACTYPKYTPGQQVTNTNSKATFEQPFSQIIGATPIMRLRVGDVIKSNYSRFNLARFFGIGSETTKVTTYDANGGKIGIGDVLGVLANPTGVSFGKASEIYDGYRMIAFYSLFGSPVASLASVIDKFSPGATSTAIGSVLKSTATNVASNFLVNGFVNPLGYKLMTDILLNPDIDYASQAQINPVNFGDEVTGYQPDNFAARSLVYIKARERPYTVVDEKNRIIGKVTVRRPLRARIRERVSIGTNSNMLHVLGEDPVISIGNPASVIKETRYIADIIDTRALMTSMRDGDTPDAFGKRIIITHDEFLPDLGSVFSGAGAIIDPIGAAFDIALDAVDSQASALNLSVSSILENESTKGVAGFMSPKNNAIVRAFENNRGRGLPGVITQLQFNWLEFPWEIDWGARAPMGTKVTISFECMHDLPPGLDASGYMRAPTHNVGAVMNAVMGDPHDDKGTVSKQNFADQGASNGVRR